MAKGSSRTIMNLLRLSGLIFGLVGTFHVFRYFLHIEMKIGGIEFTHLGSLVLGSLLLLLSAACFVNSGK